MIKDLAIYAAAIYFGWMTGYFGSLACGIWATALYSVVGEGRHPSLGLTDPPKHSQGTALKRLLVRMPLLALVHPLPWAISGALYLAYLVLAVPMNTGQLVLSVSVLGGIAYGTYRILRSLNT